MSYQTFKNRVKFIANKTGVGVRVYREDGRHMARFADGTLIQGNHYSPSVLVKWGDNHTAYAKI